MTPCRALSVSWIEPHVMICVMLPEPSHTMNLSLLQA